MSQRFIGFGLGNNVPNRQKFKPHRLGKLKVKALLQLLVDFNWTFPGYETSAMFSIWMMNFRRRMFKRDNLKSLFFRPMYYILIVVWRKSLAESWQHCSGGADPAEEEEPQAGRGGVQRSPAQQARGRGLSHHGQHPPPRPEDHPGRGQL